MATFGPWGMMGMGMPMMPMGMGMPMMPIPGVMPGAPGMGFYNSLPGRFGRDMLGRGEVHTMIQDYRTKLMRL